MKIQTKFDTNQPVFFLYKNKVIESNIDSITITIDIHDRIKYVYTIKETAKSEFSTSRFNENELFSTKQLLLDSL